MGQNSKMDEVKGSASLNEQRMWRWWFESRKFEMERNVWQWKHGCGDHGEEPENSDLLSKLRGIGWW